MVVQSQISRIPPETTPVPDPTELTVELVERSERSMVSYIDGQIAVRDQRLDGMDVATALRLKELDNLHIVIRDEVGHLERLHDQKFVKVDATFSERDKLASRESDLNKVALDAAFKAQQEAVAAALKAQQEAAARQDEANQKAIDKSEAATEKTITTNQELAQSRLDALTKALDETKVRITVIEAVKSGNVEQKSEGRQSTAALVAIAGFAIMSILFLITIVGFIMEISKNASGS